MRALILAVVLALSAGVAHADSVRPNAAQQEDARPIIAQAYAQAQSGDTAGIIATLSPLVHSAAFPQLSDEQRFVAEVLLGGALSDNNRGAEALPLLQQATDFSGADGDVWTMRLWAGYAANDFPDVATCIERVRAERPDWPADELSDLLGALEEARFTPEAFPDASSLAEWAQALVAKLPEKAA